VKIIMRQVARWYNLSITYEGKAPEDLFSGKIERRLPLSGILRCWRGGHIHYRLESNKLTIVP
jgi:transmembrane sensor